MKILNLTLKNFRNYDKLDISFNNKLNIIIGNNAQGKTNILEAIFVCSLGKSFRTNKDKELINKDKDFSKIEMISKKEDRDINIQYEMKEKITDEELIKYICELVKIDDVYKILNFRRLYTKKEVSIYEYRNIKEKSFKAKLIQMEVNSNKYK